MLNILLLAFALMLVIEGLLPFLAPRVWRETFRRVTEMSDGQIRFIGLSSMLIGVVLLQRSEGGGLGVGSSQGMGSFMGGRGTANLLTRSTAILGAAFFALALTLALLTKGASQQNRSILDGPAPITAPTAPALPSLPSVPTN